MNRSWVRFPQAAQIRPPGSGWAFLYALTGRDALCARGLRPARVPAGVPAAAWLALMGRAAVCAGGWRPARVMVLLVAPRVFRAPRGAGLLCGARLLCVPVGGGPPARSPHASLRLGVVDLEARPGPAAAHRHRGQAPPPPTGAAAWPSGPSAALRTGSDGGFAALEAGCRGISGVSQL